MIPVNAVLQYVRLTRALKTSFMDRTSYGIAVLLNERNFCG